MSAARESILGQLDGRAAPQEQPSEWQSRANDPDPVATFEARMTANGGQVSRTASLAEAISLLDRVMDELGASSVVVNGDAALDSAGLGERWAGREVFAVGRSEGDLRAFCAAADVGISGVEAALAETGTLVVQSGAQQSRLATLLPPVHVALVPESAIVPDIHTWFALSKTGVPSMVTMISGPSKTADIELVLAVGVHGPRQLVVILYPA